MQASSRPAAEQVVSTPMTIERLKSLSLSTRKRLFGHLKQFAQGHNHYRMPTQTHLVQILKGCGSDGNLLQIEMLATLSASGDTDKWQKGATEAARIWGSAVCITFDGKSVDGSHIRETPFCAEGVTIGQIKEGIQRRTLTLIPRRSKEKSTTELLTLVAYGTRSDVYLMTWIMIMRDVFGFQVRNREFEAPRKWWLKEIGWSYLAQIQSEESDDVG